MTVIRLRRILDGLIAEGHGRKPVVVDKPSFVHSLEADGAVILDLYKVNVEWVRMLADDGGTQENKDGTEHGKVQCVLRGTL